MLDMAEKVLDFFEAKYGSDTQGVGAGKLFLAFEAAGRQVIASDFKVYPQDAEPNPALVREYCANLVDFPAEIDKDGVMLPQTDLSPSISGQYHSLLESARPRPGSNLDAFLVLQGKAKTDFDNLKDNLHLMDFWPVRLSPSAWFDDADPAGWERYEYTEGAPAPGHAEPRLWKKGWDWRVVTPQAADLWKRVAAVQKLEAGHPILTELHVRNATAVGVGEDRLRVLNAAKPLMATLSPSARPMGRAVLTRSAVGRVTIGGPTVTPTVDQPIPVKFNPMTVRSVALGRVLRELPAKPPTSNGFKMSFQYRVVDISRPWLSAEFLRAPDWYLPGMSQGATASGTFVQPASPMSYLPSKFLVTKDLRITANWSTEDRRLLEGRAASLGPFTLENSEFKNNELSDPGMRIIGWFCQVAPMLPPCADPALPAPN